MLDKTTLKLFGKFPREVGNPARSVVYNLKGLENFIINNNGIHDCYASVYPLTGEIDKISFDADGKGALSESKQLYKNLRSQSFKVIPLVSGKKGFHLHALMKPKKYNPGKELLLNSTLKILEDAFGVNEKGELRCKSIDSHTFGDVRQIFRIPNTLRPPENRNWCTFLPQDEFLDMTYIDVAEHMKTVHTYQYTGDLLPTLEEFPETKVKMKPITTIETDEEITVGKGHPILKNVLRPCLYRHIRSSNPCHAVRVATTVDLLQFFTSSEIFRMFGSLHWSDWNPETTRYQIDHCRGLQSFSCKTLKRKGIPRKCCVD